LKTLKTDGDPDFDMNFSSGNYTVDDLKEAFLVAETVEKICRIFVLSSMLGGVNPLPEEGIEYQRMMYEMKKEF
jgi:ribulose-5-phosphate 4-epimerase/fuculose-1-phosphate aldolase